MARQVSSVQIGSVFGKLTVIQELPRVMTPSGRDRPQVLVRCVCGNEYPLQNTGLVKGTSTRCRECAAKESLRLVQIGQRFDQVVVQRYINEVDEHGRTRAMVECLCDCGGKVVIRSRVLVDNQTNNCGCAPRGKWTGEGVISTTLFNRMRGRAKDRGQEFTVTHADISAIYEAQNRKCALSGYPITFSRYTAGNSTASLDRIDSTKGYILGNVQWLHRDVNLMKLDFTVNEFVSMCRRVATFAKDIEDVQPRERLNRGPSISRILS